MATRPSSHAAKAPNRAKASAGPFTGGFPRTSRRTGGPPGPRGLPVNAVRLAPSPIHLLRRRRPAQFLTQPLLELAALQRLPGRPAHNRIDRDDPEDGFEHDSHEDAP